MKTFSAPWSRLLIVISILATLVCVAIAFLPHTVTTPATAKFYWLRVIPVVLVLFSALFTIRGFAITPEAIFVRRLFWSTPLPLAGLQSASFQPDSLRHAWRICGNGGLFSFSGIYRNSQLGNFRAFVTDPQRAVVLRFAKRTVVLSPSEPEEFVRSLAPHLAAV